MFVASLSLLATTLAAPPAPTPSTTAPAAPPVSASVKVEAAAPVAKPAPTAPAAPSASAATVAPAAPSAPAASAQGNTQAPAAPTLNLPSEPMSHGVQTDVNAGAPVQDPPAAAVEAPKPAVPVPPMAPSVTNQHPHAGHGPKGERAGCDHHSRGGSPHDGCEWKHGEGRGDGDCDKSGCAKSDCEGSKGCDYGKSDCDKSDCDRRKGCDYGKSDADCEGKKSCPYGKNEKGCMWSKPPKLEFGVQAFTRGEAYLHPNVNKDAENRTQILDRIRLQGQGTWGHLKVFGQVQHVGTWGGDKNSFATNSDIDLHQGYFEWGVKKPSEKYESYLRVGRQEINFGDQRLIGSLNWAPGARAFDAIRLHTTTSLFDFDLAWMVQRGRGPVTDTSVEPDVTRQGSGKSLGAFRLAVHPAKAFNAELLSLFQHDDQGTKLTSSDIGNGGLRLYGSPIAGLSYTAEGNVQWGNNKGLSHRAWAGAANAQYLYGVDKHHLNPGLRAGYTIASGDKDATDKKSKEFFNFYPTNHIHYGLMDLFGWRNMRDLEIGAVLAGNGGKMGRLDVTYHFFQLNEEKGRWTNATGGVIAEADPTNTDRNLGHELDFQLTLTPAKPVFVQLGYGAFIPTGAGKKLPVAGGGRSGVQHNMFLWLVYTL